MTIKNTTNLRKQLKINKKQLKILYKKQTKKT